MSLAHLLQTFHLLIMKMLNTYNLVMVDCVLLHVTS